MRNDQEVGFPDWLQADARLIEEKLGMAIDYYGPPTWRVGEIEPLKALEDAARSSLDLLAGRSSNDVEWSRTRSRLLDFAAMLREWAQKAQKSEQELGNVDAICQPEP